MRANVYYETRGNEPTFSKNERKCAATEKNAVWAQQSIPAAGNCQKLHFCAFKYDP